MHYECWQADCFSKDENIVKMTEDPHWRVFIFVLHCGEDLFISLIQSIDNQYETNLSIQETVSISQTRFYTMENLKNKTYNRVCEFTERSLH